MTNHTTKSIKVKILTLAVLLASFFGLSTALTPFFTTDVYAANVCDYLDSSSEAYKANGCGGSSTEDLQNVIVGAVNGVIGAIGLVALIFVLIGGINLTTSAGDPGKVQKAKTTIIYALIGMAICALSFAIVNFVIVNILG